VADAPPPPPITLEVARDFVVEAFFRAARLQIQPFEEDFLAACRGEGSTLPLTIFIELIIVQTVDLQHALMAKWIHLCPQVPLALVVHEACLNRLVKGADRSPEEMRALWKSAERVYRKVPTDDPTQFFVRRIAQLTGFRNSWITMPNSKATRRMIDGVMERLSWMKPEPSPPPRA
jgi:hypothetical protein